MHGWQYISKRLVTETVQAEQAVRRVNVTGSASFGGLGGTTEARDPEYTNVFELADRTTEIVKSRVRSIDDPGLKEGDIVRGVFNLHEADFAVWLNWGRNDTTEVASFVVAERYPWGRVFIGLFGSAHNWTLDATTRSHTGRPASDARGLYELLAAEAIDGSEANSRFAALVSEDRAAREEQEVGRFDSVLSSIAGSPFRANRHPREVLFVVHDIQHSARLRLEDTNGRRLGAFDLAIIGAPIWVRDAPASAFAPNADGLRPYQLGSGHVPSPQVVAPTYFRDPITRRDIWSAAPAHGHTEGWQTWDDISSQFADHLLGTPDPEAGAAIPADYLDREVDRLIVTSAVWEDLCRWFSDQAQSFGGAAVELHVHPRRRLMWWRYDNSEYVASGRYGRVICARDERGRGSETALVLTEGLVVEASEDGHVRGDDELKPVTLEDARKWAIAMLLQSSLWRASPLE